MYNARSIPYILISGIFFLTSAVGINRDGKVFLFNGKDLEGWDTYIGAPYDSVQQKFTGKPLGLNHDPGGVFSVMEIDNKPAIRISGENFGGISTQTAFKNYHFQLEFKWGSLKWHPKKNSKRDSGLLYHAVGEHGADGGFWMPIAGVSDTGRRLRRLLGSCRRGGGYPRGQIRGEVYVFTRQSVTDL